MAQRAAFGKPLVDEGKMQHKWAAQLDSLPQDRRACDSHVAEWLNSDWTRNSTTLSKKTKSRSDLVFQCEFHLLDEHLRSSRYANAVARSTASSVLGTIGESSTRRTSASPTRTSTLARSSTGLTRLTSPAAITSTLSRSSTDLTRLPSAAASVSSSS